MTAISHALLEEALNWTPEMAQETFHGLPAPRPDDVEGEFDGYVPYARRKDWDELMAQARLGTWLGKGYVPQCKGASSGTGYNRYRRSGGLQRRLRFAWSIDRSSIDGRDTLLMRYSAFDNWAGQRDLIDELRMLERGLWLGLFYTRKPEPLFTPRPGNGRSGIEFFILAGPVGPAHQS